MRCSCLSAEYVGRVRKDGGKATAVSTVVPSMFGNSVRISSQTIPAYDPALWPQMESTAAICSACLMLSDAFCDGELDESEFSPVADNYPSAQLSSGELEKKFREEEQLGRMFPFKTWCSETEVHSKTD